MILCESAIKFEQVYVYCHKVPSKYLLVYNTLLYFELYKNTFVQWLSLQINPTLIKCLKLFIALRVQNIYT